MKALSLTQPYASLIACGAKHVETRAWSTPYRGPLAIHASKGFPGWAKECCDEPPFDYTLAEHGLTERTLPLGAIIAVCRLYKVIPVERVVMVSADPFHPAYERGFVEHCPDRFCISVVERAFGDYSVGRFAWLLTDIRALPEPIPAKGALGLWECADPRLLDFASEGSRHDAGVTA